MRKAKSRNGPFWIDPKGAPTVKPSNIVIGLIDDGQADNGIDEIFIRMEPAEYAAEQGEAVAKCEQADIDQNVFENPKSTWSIPVTMCLAPRYRKGMGATPEIDSI